MSPALRAAIDAADDLAWRPTSNIHGTGYGDRYEASQRLVERLTAVHSLSANASPELRFLVAAVLLEGVA